MHRKPRILVSACLLGARCRYDGRANTCPAALALADCAELIPVCPEQLGGLGTPRPACEIWAGHVVDEGGVDRTAAFRRGAEAVLALSKTYGATQALLQNRSPSCGSGWIYDGTFSKKLVPGDGITAQLLKENGIQVIGID